MELTVGTILDGKVKSLTKFGAFVTLPDNSTGMVHISEVAHAYVNDIHDYLAEGQDVKVMVIGLDNNKINLSIKRTLPVPPRQPMNRGSRPPYDRNQGGQGGQSGQSSQSRTSPTTAASPEIPPPIRPATSARGRTSPRSRSRSRSTTCSSSS
jgi:S1 RNA binding domain protein